MSFEQVASLVVSVDYHKERLDVFLFDCFFKERQVSKSSLGKTIQYSNGEHSKYRFLYNNDETNKPALKLRHGDVIIVKELMVQQPSKKKTSLVSHNDDNTSSPTSSTLEQHLALNGSGSGEEEEENTNTSLPSNEIIMPENIPLNILFEDDFLIVLDKPKFMTVHPSLKPKPRNTSGTLVNALLYHTNGKLSTCGSCEEHYRPGIVHRLDRDTSGIMVIAKDDETHLALKKLFENKNVGDENPEDKITRYYQALVENELNQSEGRIEIYIKRHHSMPSKREVTNNPLEAGAKLSITEYKEQKVFSVSNLTGCKVLTLVRCKLLTGRTHQIRVSMAHLTRPLVGDVLYNPRFKSSKKTKKKKQSKQEEEFEKFATGKGQFLHASYLGFKHPKTGKYLEFTSNTPDYFTEAINLLNSKN